MTNAAGCDSVLTLNLIINHSSSFSQSVTLSIGDSITIGTHTYTTKDTSGTYVDILKASNNCDSIVTTNLTVHTGISTFAELNVKVSIYPNPLTSSTTIEIVNTEQGIKYYELNLYDVLGQPVKTINISSHITYFSKENLPEGVYFYQILDGETLKKTGKLLILD